MGPLWRASESSVPMNKYGGYLNCTIQYDDGEEKTDQLHPSWGPLAVTVMHLRKSCAH